MSEQRRPYNEKQEKQEKEQEKQEKSWDEKWRRDPLSAAVWAMILIWAGLVLLAANLNLFGWDTGNVWPYIFLGAGVILLLEVGFRMLVPAYRQPFRGNFVLALVFVAIGLGQLVGNWSVIWAIVLIGIGVYALLGGLFRRRE
jgi:uncharacterized membrane protein